MSEILGDKLNIIYEDTLLEITPELMKKTIVSQDKEIERLNKARKFDVEYNKNLQKEIIRLNNIINKGIEAINVYQNEKTLSVGYQDLKRIRGILQGNEFDLQMFEEYLQELKGER